MSLKLQIKNFTPSANKASTIGFMGSLMILFSSHRVGWATESGENFLKRYLIIVAEKPQDSILENTTLNILILSFGLLSILYSWMLIGTTSPNIKNLKKYLTYTTIPLLFSLPFISRDIYAYFAQGQVLNNGNNPYQNPANILPNWETTGIDPLWSNVTTPYGPTFLLIAKYVSAIAQDNSIIMLAIFRTINILSIAIIFQTTKKLAQIQKIPTNKALWLIAVNPLTLIYFTATIQNDAILVALILAAFLKAKTKNPTQAILFITLAAGIKIIALVLLPFIGIIIAQQHNNTTTTNPIQKTKHPTWKQLTTIWTTTATATLLSLFLLGQAMNIGTGWTKTSISATSNTFSSLSPIYILNKIIINIQTITRQENLPTTKNITLQSMSLTMALISIIITTYLILTYKKRDPLLGAALSMGSFIIISPNLQGWYFLWTLPLLALSQIPPQNKFTPKKQTQTIIITILAVYSLGILDIYRINVNNTEITQTLILLILIAPKIIIIYLALYHKKTKNLIKNPKQLFNNPN